MDSSRERIAAAIRGAFGIRFNGMVTNQAALDAADAVLELVDNADAV